MIYFDNAATGGRKPERVVSAVTSSLKVCANPGRSGHKLSLSCAVSVSETRAALSDYFSAYGTERTVFTKSCTEALNLAFSGLFEKGDHVVTTCMEHNSVLRPLERLKTIGMIEYDVCPLKNGTIDESELASLVKSNTKAVVITAASNVTGATPRLNLLRKHIPERVLLIVDGAQGGGHLPVRMTDWGIDALALAGHKGMMGMQGSGVLLFSDRLSPASILCGGTGSESYSLSMPDYYPDALEAGTCSFPAIIALFEGLRYLSRYEKKNAEYLLALSKKIILGLKRLPNVRVFSEPNVCGIAAFEIQNRPSEEIATILSEKYSVAVRGGLHCAPLMHKALGTSENGLVRVSLSPFNTTSEADEFLRSMKHLTNGSI